MQVKGGTGRRQDPLDLPKGTHLGLHPLRERARLSSAGGNSGQTEVLGM